MASASVCEKHERYCPDGVCPYCEQPAPGLNAAMPAGNIFGIDNPPPLIPVLVHYVNCTIFSGCVCNCTEIASSHT